MNFEGHMKHLCRLFNRFKGALDRSSSEAAIRRAVDDLFELAFETDPNALVNSSYLVESKVNVVKYDERRLPHGPTSVATADGAVVIPLPTQVLQTLRTGGVVYAGPDLHEEYILSFVEYKGGLSNNGRQAILDSAAMQAVNRALGLDGVKNYAFSVHHAKVDIITSWWDQEDNEVNSFLKDLPAVRDAKILVNILQVGNQVNAIVVATPEYQVSARQCDQSGWISLYHRQERGVCLREGAGEQESR
ncbi:hypothetical protein B0H14DRAFT_3854240 [Mycena olivaceomarginata]|nr:hypothetical protein B0H14DRAFT_3854240 [Mycena olivaceomarginata]